jgi:hypothetical protein
VAAAALGAAAGSVEGAKAAEGALRKLVDALNQSIVTFDWGRDPKTRKIVLQGVHVNVTTGLVLGGVALALFWELGNWIAQALNNAGPDVIPDLSDLMTAPAKVLSTVPGSPWWVYKEITSLLPHSGTEPTTPTTKTVAVPATAGQAYNAMIRDLILSGPGTAANQLAALVAKLIPETS